MTEIGDAQSLWGDADLEAGGREGGDGEAAAVDGDGVAILAIFEEGGFGGDRDGHSGAGLYIFVEIGDDFFVLEMRDELEGGLHTSDLFHKTSEHDEG